MKTTPEKPGKVTGIAHLFAATRYSAAGFIRLWGETAFRHELVTGTLALIVLLAVKAPAWALFAVSILALITLAVEALNTAIEELLEQYQPLIEEGRPYFLDAGEAEVVQAKMRSAKKN